MTTPTASMWSSLEAVQDLVSSQQAELDRLHGEVEALKAGVAALKAERAQPKPAGWPAGVTPLRAAGRAAHPSVRRGPDGAA